MHNVFACLEIYNKSNTYDNYRQNSRVQLNAYDTQGYFKTINDEESFLHQRKVSVIKLGAT